MNWSVLRMFFMWLFVAILAGVCQPVQGGVNSQLRAKVSSPFLSGAISNFIGAIIMLTVGLLVQKEPLTFPKFEWNQWWIWTGGILSFMIVIATIIIPGKISYTTFFGAFITGQLIMATVIDAFGLFGGEPVPLDFKRAIGILLLIVGVLLVKK